MFKKLLVFVWLISLYFAHPESASAQYSVPVTPISQRFLDAGEDGDTGTYDCMAASLTMALAVLPRSDGVMPPMYEEVRQKLRSIQPDPTKGISPNALMVITPQVSNNDYRLIVETKDASSWESYLTYELARKRPVIAHIPSRFALEDPTDTRPASHVVVISAMTDSTITYADSWDARLHTLSHKAFLAAWGNGPYAFVMFRFVPVPHMPLFPNSFSS